MAILVDLAHLQRKGLADPVGELTKGWKGPAGGVYELLSALVIGLHHTAEHNAQGPAVDRTQVLPWTSILAVPLQNPINHLLVVGTVTMMGALQP